MIRGEAGNSGAVIFRAWNGGVGSRGDKPWALPKARVGVVGVGPTARSLD